MIIEKKMERTVSRTKKLTVSSASEVTTIWRYTNVYIIIIIIIIIKQSLQNWRLKLAGALADHNRNVLT